MSSNSFTRPTSVMSLLADKMQCEMSLIEGCTSRQIDIKSSKKHSSISSSAPTYRYSIPGTCFNCLNFPCDSSIDEKCQVSNESDLSSPHFPSKRLCHSSTNDCITRPIPIKLSSRYQFRYIPETSGPLDYDNFVSEPIKPSQKNPCNLGVRPIISPHYKKSAFTPTGSLISPQTSSDYSISPDIESPVHRPVSTTSSGFHDCSQQSLLIDPNCSPDSNQISNCATIVNTRPPESHTSVFPRCHSQPCDEPLSKNFSNRPVFIGTHNQTIKYPYKPHTPMKRRYTSPSRIRSTSYSDNTNVKMFDSPTQCHCNNVIVNSADTSPNASGSLFATPKREGYFFGGGRSYLISLPRIASSPPPVSTQVDCQNNSQVPRQRIGSNSSSQSTSTTTDTNTPTVIYNGAIQQKTITDSTNYTRDNVEDVEMTEICNEKRQTIRPHNQCHDECDCGPEKRAIHMYSELSCIVPNSDGGLCCVSPSSCSASAVSDVTTKSYSTNSDDASNSTHVSHSIDSESSRSEFRDLEDPPEIGFYFNQLNDHQDAIAYNKNSSFQELDLDQIELD